MPEHVRAWLYRIAVAIMPLLILYGVLSDTEAALWLGIVAAILSVGESALAARHTDRRRPDPQALDQLRRHVDHQRGTDA